MRDFHWPQTLAAPPGVAPRPAFAAVQWTEHISPDGLLFLFNNANGLAYYREWLEKRLPDGRAIVTNCYTDEVQWAIATERLLPPVRQLASNARQPAAQSHGRCLPAIVLKTALFAML